MKFILEHKKGFEKGVEAEKEKGPEKEEKEGVGLLTIHKAKGLEYEVVFIIQANEGGIPYKRSCGVRHPHYI